MPYCRPLPLLVRCSFSSGSPPFINMNRRAMLKTPVGWWLHRIILVHVYIYICIYIHSYMHTDIHVYILLDIYNVEYHDQNELGIPFWTNQKISWCSNLGFERCGSGFDHVDFVRTITVSLCKNPFSIANDRHSKVTYKYHGVDCLIEVYISLYYPTTSLWSG